MKMWQHCLYVFSIIVVTSLITTVNSGRDEHYGQFNKGGTYFSCEDACTPLKPDCYDQCIDYLEYVRKYGNQFLLKTSQPPQGGDISTTQQPLTTHTSQPPQGGDISTTQQPLITHKSDSGNKLAIVLSIVSPILGIAILVLLVYVLRLKCCSREKNSNKNKSADVECRLSACLQTESRSPSIEESNFTDDNVGLLCKHSDTRSECINPNFQTRSATTDNNVQTRSAAVVNNSQIRAATVNNNFQTRSTTADNNCQIRAATVNNNSETRSVAVNNNSQTRCGIVNNYPQTTSVIMSNTDSAAASTVTVEQAAGNVRDSSHNSINIYEAIASAKTPKTKSITNDQIMPRESNNSPMKEISDNQYTFDRAPLDVHCNQLSTGIRDVPVQSPRDINNQNRSQQNVHPDHNVLCRNEAAIIKPKNLKEHSEHIEQWRREKTKPLHKNNTDRNNPAHLPRPQHDLAPLSKPKCKKSTSETKPAVNEKAETRIEEPRFSINDLYADPQKPPGTDFKASGAEAGCQDSIKNPDSVKQDQSKSESRELAYKRESEP